MTTDFSDSTTSEHPNMSLGRLPPEMLFQIADWVPIPDLRVLGRVNHQFSGIVDGYCKVYQYKLGLFRLPESVLQQIMGHLDTVDEQSRLARTSQKLYPVVMKSLVSIASDAHKSALLVHAAMRNNVPLAKKVVRLGGDVNWKQAGTHLHRGPPLSTAVKLGHADIARFLLQAGANPLNEHGDRADLMNAFRLGHDEVALVLCEGLSQMDTTCGHISAGYSILSEACRFERSIVVESLLARGHPGQTAQESIHTRSELLHLILRKHAWGGKLVVDGKLIEKHLDEVFKITKLLLEHEADPDMIFQHWVHSMYTSYSASRKWGKHSPDLRIRALFATAGTQPTDDPKKPSQENGKLKRDHRANGRKEMQRQHELTAQPKGWREREAKRAANRSGIEGSWRHPEAPSRESKPVQLEWRKDAGSKVSPTLDWQK